MPLASFKKTSSLTSIDVAKIRDFLDGQQPFFLYFNSALADLERGIDNRWFHIDHDGLIIGIDFQEIQVITIIGEVRNELVEELSYPTRRTEFHVSEDHAAMIAKQAGERVVKTAHLKYYLLNVSQPFEVDESHVRLLSPADLAEVELFYDRFYASRIFSPWMLEQPFIGLFIDNQLVSAGGTVVIDNQSATANIGNFLTHPLYRGRKYSQIVVKSLINRLLESKITTFTLGTTEENQPACRAYEATGFHVHGRRIELEIVPGQALL